MCQQITSEQETLKKEKKEEKNQQQQNNHTFGIRMSGRSLLSASKCREAWTVCADRSDLGSLTRDEEEREIHGLSLQCLYNI